MLIWIVTDIFNDYCGGHRHIYPFLNEKNARKKFEELKKKLYDFSNSSSIFQTYSSTDKVYCRSLCNNEYKHDVEINFYEIVDANV